MSPKLMPPLLAGCRVVAYTGWLGVMVRVKKSHAAVPGAEEYICQCPRCLTLETLWFRADVLVPTIKFCQGEDGRIYHDCNRGSVPAVLYGGRPEKIAGVIIAGGSLVPGLRLVSLVPAAVLVAAPNSPSKEGGSNPPKQCR